MYASKAQPLKKNLKEDEVTGLVLQVQDYKDADGIIRLLTPDDGLLSIYARGVQKETSKNRRLALPFSEVRLQYLPQYSKDLLYLSRGASTAYYHRINDSLVHQSVCFVLRDLIHDENLYPGIFQDVQRLWQAFDAGDASEGYLMACLILAFLIRKMGIEPDFSGCVECGRTDHLVTLSKEEGGLICKEHLTEQMQIIPAKRLQALRALFRAGHQNIPVLKEHFHYDLKDFLFLCSWMEYHMDRSWASIRFLETISAMEPQNQKKK